MNNTDRAMRNAFERNWGRIWDDKALECHNWKLAWNAAKAADYSLRAMQKRLPWTIPYSDEFTASKAVNPRRSVAHDVLHVMKSLGRIAAECEGADHARPAKLVGDALAKEVADLVICALHIAELENFDLQDAVIDNSALRNNVDFRGSLNELA